MIDMLSNITQNSHDKRVLPERIVTRETYLVAVYTYVAEIHYTCLNVTRRERL